MIIPPFNFLLIVCSISAFTCSILRWELAHEFVSDRNFLFSAESFIYILAIIFDCQKVYLSVQSTVKSLNKCSFSLSPEILEFDIQRYQQISWYNQCYFWNSLKKCLLTNFNAQGSLTIVQAYAYWLKLKVNQNSDSLLIYGESFSSFIAINCCLVEVFKLVGIFYIFFKNLFVPVFFVI